jgi:putative DNA methylase
VTTGVKTRKKLIEVALPLEKINEAAAREKSIRHGHPSTLHLWWARRPLAAARAVIFAQMVDDPSSHPELFPTEEAQEVERQRLFGIIEQLVKWENTTKERVLNAARAEIWKSWRSCCEDNRDHPRAAELFNPDKLPAFHDPFAGGGALPLEAQRLGLEAWASDLNPVAVTINKAMIEIPPKFADHKPIGPLPSGEKQASLPKDWPGATGLAEDVRRYGAWMRAEAERSIGNLYPKVKITEEIAVERPDLKSLVGENLTVIAWLWARTVKSPDPAFADVYVPLASTFLLSTKTGKEAYVEPVIDGKSYRFTVKVGKPPESAKNGTKLARGANFSCLMSNSPIAPEYIKSEGSAHRMGTHLMAIVAEGERGRVYLPSIAEHESAASKASPKWRPDTSLPDDPRNFWTIPYGLITFGDLFTPRQLVALNTFSDLVHKAIDKCRSDAIASGMPNDKLGLEAGGIGSNAYAEAVGLYLSLALSRLSDAQNSLCQWGPSANQTQHLFRRQAIPMVWDYAESSVFSGAAGDFMTSLHTMCRVLVTMDSRVFGRSEQADAQTQAISARKVVSTDPPYYDNIGYADLSDFFYVWLRQALQSSFTNLYSTVAVPKVDELVASPYRHGSKESAEQFFLEGMTRAMHHLSQQVHPAFPTTIYYAFKQAESDDESGTSSTGWETFLQAVIESGFAITGTWPVRTERETRSIGIGTNALASSIVLVCCRRDSDASTITRREFLNSLKFDLPIALAHLQHSNIAPVDLQQAAIGPGMAIFSRYSKVLNASGEAMTVNEALRLINETLDEALAEQEGDFDADTRWALAWFEQRGFAEGSFGEADVLSRAKNTSVDGMRQAGILQTGAGKVRLLKPEELDSEWSPEEDTRQPVWETLHHLIRAMNHGGEPEAAALATRLGFRADTARELAYRLYLSCERRKRAQEALAYNALVQSWPEIQRLANESQSIAVQPRQAELYS